MAAGDIRSQDDYMQETAKLIPAETLALYLPVSRQGKVAIGDKVPEEGEYLVK